MSERALRKTRVGKVVSDKMDKTIVVAIEDRVAHPLYKKVIPHTEVEEVLLRKGNGDPSAVQGQALETGRDYREGKVRRRAHGSAGKLSACS